MKNKYAGFILLFTALLMGGNDDLKAQVTGGQEVFQFMMLSQSARTTGLGGTQITVRDDDVVFASANPAALNPQMDGRLHFNHNFFLSDVQHGTVAYVHDLPKIGFTVHGGLQYIGYGEIKQADEFGNITGTIKASETAFTLGGGRQLNDRFSLGMNVRFGVSTLDVYQASALAVDAGVLYSDTSSLFAAGLVLRNYGVQLAAYNNTKEDIPYDLQIGISKRLRYLPFRLTIIAHHLHKWDLTYDNPDLADDGGDIFAQDNNQGNPAIDNFFRHFIFSGEFLFGQTEAFRVRLGYNHLLKRELTVASYRSLAGFSAGIGMRISRFRIDVGYGSYHLAGGVLHMGIGTNLKEFF